MHKFFTFYKTDLKIDDLSSDSNIKMSIIDSFGDEVELCYGDNGRIKLLPEKNETYISTLGHFGRFEVIGEDFTILKYLFEKYGLMFYSDEYLELVEYLDEEKDFEYYDHIVRKHIVETMVHYGMVTEIGVFGEKFFNPYIIHDANILRYKRMRRDLLWCKIKLFFKKILNFFGIE